MKNTPGDGVLGLKMKNIDTSRGSGRFLASLSGSFLRTSKPDSYRARAGAEAVVRPRGSSRSCTRGGKSRMSNVAAGNRFGGKSVATTLSSERTHRHRRRRRGVFPGAAATAAANSNTCKFTVSRSPSCAIVRTTTLECGPRIR
jgi:hypothetical protein